MSRQRIKKFYEHVFLLHNSVYTSWSPAATGKGKNILTVYIQTHTVSIMELWTPQPMTFLCMVLPSVLGVIKEKHNCRWLGRAGESKGRGVLCLFLDKWRGIVSGTSDSGLRTFPGTPSGDSETFLRTESKKCPSWGPLMLPLQPWKWQWVPVTFYVHSICYKDIIFSHVRLP